MEIGKKIKDLRIQKNLTQEELADRCELSKGFISQLERDLTSPSIATLIDILQCLGTDLKHFFNDSDDDQISFKETDYFEKTDEALGNRIEWIMEKGGSTYPDNPHEGEEFGYVLSGSICLTLGNRIIRVRKGESFYFTANTTHYIRASEKTGATLIWVSTPPSF